MNKNKLVKKEFAITLKEMSKSQPLSSITVSALAKRCGISRGTFYYHFIDLYDLINWVFETEIVEPLQIHILSNSHGHWYGITKYCLQKMYDSKEFYCQAVRVDGQNNLRDYMQVKNLESWNLLIGKYLSDTHQTYNSTTLNFMTKFTSQAVCNMIIEWTIDGMRIPVELMAKMDDVATKGIYGIIDSVDNSHRT